MMDVFLYGKSLKQTSLDKVKNLKQQCVWIDLIDTDERELQRLSKRFDLHPLTVEDMQHRNVRVKVEVFNQYLFIVVYGLEKENGYRMLEGDYVIGKNFVISSHKKELRSHRNLKENPELLGKIMAKGADFLLHKLLDNSIEETLPVIEHVEDEVASIEKQVTANPDKNIINRILKLKQQVFGMRKIAFAQREKVGLLVINDYPYLTKDSRPYYRDLYDRTIMIADAVEAARESVQSAFDAYMSAVNNRMGEVMKVLSIIATIALPLTVISSVWGTNFINLPGIHSENGFWIMISFMALMVGVMFIWFAKKKWV